MIAITYFALLPVLCSAYRVSMDQLQKELAVDKKRENTEADKILVQFPDTTWFGLATAAAHVETAFPGDPWVDWAKKGNVAAYDTVAKKGNVAGNNPDMRLKFLEEPEVELDLAAATGVQVFRMGVEWGRLVTETPQPGQGVQDQAALNRYREIIEYAKGMKALNGKKIAKSMKVMMTLFHHSMPAWAGEGGGWTSDATVKYFVDFAKDVATQLHDVVDYWVTFNEPHVFVLLSNCAALWPGKPGAKPKGTVEQLGCLTGALPFVSKTSGGYTKAMHNIEQSHIQFYDWAHGGGGLTEPRIGVAHNVAWNEAQGMADVASVQITESLFKFPFIDHLKSKLDWLGLNYYSKEVIGGAGPVILPEEEYSESGRTVYPNGLYDTLMQFHRRYPMSDPTVTFKSVIITENGISDSSDILRPSYIVEHLLAVREAQNQGMNIEGYVHWTISDNWEWADGYCPKFGLVDVDRSDDELRRTTRPSYDLFTKIVATKTVTHQQREESWEVVRQAVVEGKTHNFCRSYTSNAGLDEPVQRPIKNKDWRFSKLSQEDTGTAGQVQCHKTPWAVKVESERTDIVAHTSKAECHVTPTATSDTNKTGIPAHCRRSVAIQRETHCPGNNATTEEVGVVCEPNKLAQTNLGKDAFDFTDCGAYHAGALSMLKCCCDGADRCGFSESHWFTCPGGLTVKERAACETH